MSFHAQVKMFAFHFHPQNQSQFNIISILRDFNKKKRGLSEKRILSMGAQSNNTSKKASRRQRNEFILILYL